jgi:hypothetical protein
MSRRWRSALLSAVTGALAMACSVPGIAGAAATPRQGRFAGEIAIGGGRAL